MRPLHKILTTIGSLLCEYLWELPSNSERDTNLTYSDYTGKRSADSPTPSPRAPTGHEIVTGCITLGNHFPFSNITTKLYSPTYLQWYHNANKLRFASYYLLTNSTEQILSTQLTSYRLVKKFPAFYETRGFITTFTSARHLSLIWASSMQSMPPIKLPEDSS
jgi:hypothetical protein